jgi:hypothetical protein
VNVFRKYRPARRAAKHGKQPGHWLDELQDVVLFRAQAHLSDRGRAAAPSLMFMSVNSSTRLWRGFGPIPEC